MSSHKSLFTKTVGKKAKLDNEEKQADTTLATSENSGASTSVKKPAFNPALLNSAFYTGPISYGGAGISSSMSPYNQYHTSKFYDKKKIDIKVIPSGTNNTAGQIAKTICECLETYSSPVSDAKRVPINNRPPFSSQGRTFSNLSIFDTSRRSLLNDSLTPSRPHRSRELQIPSIAALSKMKKTNRCNNPRAAILASMSSSMPCEPKMYKVRSEEDNSTYKNKIKNKINTVRGVRNDEEEMAQPVHLQNISLNITNLPTFSESAFSATSSVKYLVLEKKTSSPPVNIASVENNFKFASSVSVKETGSSKTSKFKFSEPVDIFNPSEVEKLTKDEVLSTPSFVKDTPSSNSSGLKFSNPDSPSTLFTNFKAGDKYSPKPKEKPSYESWNGIDTNKKNIDKPSLVNGDMQHGSTGKRSHSDIACESTLDSDENANIKKIKGDLPKDNSLDSFIKKQQQQWECNSCMTRNDQSKDKCVCCEASKPGGSVAKPAASSQSAAFGSFIKKQLEQWECPSCLTRNDQSKDKCVCCEASKPGASTKPSTNASPFFTNIMKKQSEQWECSSCMTRNDQSKDKCVCCEASKPGLVSTNNTTNSLPAVPSSTGFGNLIKKQQEQWECSCCMTRNEQNRNKCVCCEASKPGSEPAKATSVNFNFGTTQNTFKFGIDKADTAKSTVAATNTTEVKPLTTTSVTGFTFGSQSTTDNKTANGNIGGFKFGVPSAVSTASESVTSTTVPTPAFSFGEKKESTSTTPAAGFSFGIKSTTEKSSSSIGASSVDPKPTGFTFGVVQKDSKVKKDIVSVTPKPEDKVVKSVNTPKTTSSSIIAPPSDTKPMFSFNAQPKAEFSSKAFQFGAPASTTTSTTSETFTPSKTFSFEAKTDSAPKPSFQLPTSNAGNIFSSSNSIQKAETDNKPSTALPGIQFTSNVAAEKPKDQPPPSYFTFGSSATSAPSSNTFKSPMSSAPTFTFGSAATSKPEGSSLFNVPTTTSATTSLFGSPNVSTEQSSTTTNPLFKPQTTTTPTFGSTATNIFKADSTPSTNVFGSSALSPPGSKPPAVLFGGSSLNSDQSVNKPAQSTTSPFSSTSVPTFGAGNIFGNAASSTTVSPFGSSLNKPAESSNNMFSTPAPSAPLFPPPSATSPQNSNPIFGSSPAVPTPVFGASIPFGESSQNQSQQSLPFKFGAPSSAQPPAMGFGQAPAAGSSAPIFSFGSNSPAPLSNSQYNFSMGNMPAPRKFKKAVRRNNVR